MNLKYVMEPIVFYIAFSYFCSLDMAATGDCPPGQVLHTNPVNRKGLCCIPVPIQRGYRAVECSVEHTEDGFQKCQNGTHQPDETSSQHMPECIADPQCTNEGIKMDYRCIDEYCWPVCICSLEHGKCGLNPFDCTDINKITCPSTVLPNCSCAPPNITSTLPASSSSTVKPVRVESSVPTPTNESWIDSTKIIDKYDTTEDGADKENKWEIPVSIGCAFLVVVGVVVVLCIYYRRRKVNRENGQNTTEIEMENQDMLLSDSLVTGYDELTGHEEGAQSILSWVSVQGESIGHEVDAEPFSSEDSEETDQSGSTEQVALSGGLPQDYNGAQLDSFEVPNMSNVPDIWSPFSSGLFQSHANTTDQQEQTHVKSVVGSTNINQEEGHHSYEEAIPNMSNVPDISSPFSSGLFQSNANTTDQQEQTHVKSVVGSTNINQEEGHHSDEEAIPNMSNVPDIWSPFSSGLFQSNANTTDQQEQTHVKSVVGSTNIKQEEGHHSDEEANFELYPEGVEPILFSNGLWSDFSRSIVHGTGSDIQQAGSGIPQAGSGIPQAGSGIPQAGSDIQQAGSGIPQARSGIPQAGSDIQQAGSGIPQAGSDIQQAGSDIQQAGSDIQQAGSGIPQAGSDIQQAGSDIQQAGSDIQQAGSDIPQAGSGIPQAGSGIPQAGSGIQQAGSGIQQAGSGIPQAGSDIQQAGSDIQQAGSDIQQAGSGIPQAGSDIQQAGSDIQQAGSDIQQAGSGIPQAGSGIPQAGSGIPQAGSDIQQAGSGIPQARSGIPQAGSDIQQAGSGIPQAGSDIQQAGSDIQQAGSGIPQAGSDIQQAGSDIQQAGSDIQQAGSDIQQAGSGIPQAGSDIQQAGSDIQQAGSDIQQAGSDIQQAGSGIPQAGSDIQQAGSDIQQAGSDIQQAGSDIQQAGSDIQQAGSDIQQARSGIPQAESDIQQAGSDIQQAGSDIQQAGSDIQQAGSGIPQARSGIPQAGSGIPQARSYIAEAQSASQREVDEEDAKVHPLQD